MSDDLRSKIAAIVARQWLEPDDGSQWWRVYGITAATRDELLAVQGNACAVCRTIDEYNPSLVVDHCHATGRVRGMLCQRCNTKLGKYGYDLSAARRMVAERMAEHRRYLAYMVESKTGVGGTTKRRAAWAGAIDAQREERAKELAERDARRQAQPETEPKRWTIRLVPPPAPQPPARETFPIDRLFREVGSDLLSPWPVRHFERVGQWPRTTSVWLKRAEVDGRIAAQQASEHESWWSFEESGGRRATADNLVEGGLSAEETIAYLTVAVLRPMDSTRYSRHYKREALVAADAIREACSAVVPWDKISDWHHLSSCVVPVDAPDWDADNEADVLAGVVESLRELRADFELVCMHVVPALASVTA